MRPARSSNASFASATASPSSPGRRRDSSDTRCGASGASWRRATYYIVAMADETPLTVQVPTGNAKGGIIVVQEAFGVNDHIEDVCRRFADEGWLAVAPHLFHRTGDPKLGYTDMGEIMPHMQALTKDNVLADVDVALAEVARQGIPASRTGITGFCMGGTVTLLVDTERDLGAAVTFYGGGLKEGRFGFPPLIEAAPH